MMSSPRAQGAREPRRWRWWTAATVGALSALLVVWTGCSPSKNYKLLSFFFDGVPDPNAPPATSNGGSEEGHGGSAGRGQIVVTHKPYAEGKCAACHKANEGRSFDMGSLNADICMQCHEKVLHEHALTHGPVAVKSCLWCHYPHDSPQPHLLKGTAIEVCGQCHESGLLGPNPPEHRTGKANCLDCHSGHGGEARFFLINRAASPTSQPSTQPTTQPATVDAGDRGGGSS